MNATHHTQSDTAYISRDEFASAIDKISSAIDRGFERVNHRIDDERQHHDDQIRKLSDRQAEAGKINPSVIIGVVSLAVGIVVSGISAVAYLSNITSQNETKLDYVTEWRKTTEVWIAGNEARDNAQDIGISRLAGYNEQLGIRLEGVDARAERLEQWYNGHGQEMWGRIMALQTSVDRHQAEIEQWDEQDRRIAEIEVANARLETLIQSNPKGSP